MTELDRLPPRVRDVFQGLLVGLSEKEVATRLGISRNTVHGYIQRIYVQFKVSSRGELLAARIAVLQARVEELEGGGGPPGSAPVFPGGPPQRDEATRPASIAAVRRAAPAPPNEPCLPVR